jgi:hypothetical protein
MMNSSSFWKSLWRTNQLDEKFPNLWNTPNLTQINGGKVSNSSWKKKWQIFKESIEQIDDILGKLL